MKRSEKLYRRSWHAWMVAFFFLGVCIASGVWSVRVARGADSGGGFAWVFALAGLLAFIGWACEAVRLHGLGLEEESWEIQEEQREVEP